MLNEMKKYKSMASDPIDTKFLVVNQLKQEEVETCLV